MKTKIPLFVALALLLIGSSCQDDEDKVVDNLLSGTWIEVVDRADTIVFDNAERFFILKRGLEVQNGHMIPLYGSGIYEYTLKKDSFSLRNTLSSSSEYYDAFLKIEQHELHMGNFYQKNPKSQQVLVFEKLH